MSQHTFEDLIAAGVLEIGDGYRAKNSELGGDGPIFMRAGLLSDRGFNFSGAERFLGPRAPAVKSKLAQFGDTVITTKGNSTGRTGYVASDTPPFVYSPHLSYWRSRRTETLLPGFLRYWAQGDEFRAQLDAMKTSTDMAPYLSLTDQRRLRITVPDPRSQCGIAAVLEALDDRISHHRRANETLDGIASVLFKSWFLDFDPVVAKRDGRVPVGVPADAVQLFPRHFDDSKLGPIPSGWRVGRLGDLAQMNALSLSPKDALSEIKYIEISDVHRGDVGHCTTYARGTEPSRARRIVRHGDAVISAVRPERGAYFLCLQPSPGLLVSTGFVVLTPRCRHWGVVYCAATSDDALDYYELHADGGAYPAMRPEAVESMPIAMPPNDTLQVRLSSVVEPFLERAHANRVEAQTLAALRDALIAPLLSGEVTIKTAEKVLAKVV
jgi:type I restriction enzyme S subunit